VVTCPTCEAKYVLDRKDEIGKIVRCGLCNNRFCRTCAVVWHNGLTCEQYQQRKRQVGDEAKTLATLRLTSKPCPRCRTPITHYRGHACHHITPVSGCPSCHYHFCYVCLGPWQNRTCGCSLYCDANCGCPRCPDCRPGQPCPHCTGPGGGCLSCQGAPT